MVVDKRAEWLGDVPEHWEFYRAKYVFTQRNEKGNGSADDGYWSYLFLP